jgi:HSP20 family molecular chaperone IbpA
MKPLVSKALIGLSGFALGLATMFVAQKTFLQKPAPQPVRFGNDPFAGAFLDPFQQVRQMQQQMQEQMMNLQSGAEAGLSFQRREDAKFVYYEIPVKNLNKEKLKVRVADGQIDISGQTEDAYSSSRFRQSFPVPAEVDAQKVQMENTADKLIIKFPKIV